MNAGIDYGMGKTNRDHKTGIHYGVINQSEVLQAWADESEGVYVYFCPFCGNGPLNKGADARRCPHCYKRIDPDRDFDFSEPSGFTYSGEGYECEQHQDDTDIFVTKSPYFTYCGYCSPCAPGAGYLMDVRDAETGIKAYCFGHDWFEDNKAPYRVFGVETGEEVLP